MSDINNLVISRYLPYAKETIINRAVPYIDGFKPVARKTLWAMYELTLFKSKKKCARIVGDTMGKYHPHGDGSIYDCLCGLTDKYNGFNAPFVAGQGNFGKKSSDHKTGIKPSQMRYTEAGLSGIAPELFDGIREGAVNMIDNFDGTEKEPELLPVTFPNVIVNTNKGVAVGLSSYIPSYTLRNACLATIKVIEGAEMEDIVDVLGAPDFSTGGTIHCDKDSLMKLLKTGRASFALTGGMHPEGPNVIVIDSVPISTTFEKVAGQIKDFAATPEGRDIVDVIDNTGLGSTGVRVVLRRGSDIRSIALKLYQKTDVRSTVSFLTQIIWKGRAREFGVYQLIQNWLTFRSECIQRVYRNRAVKLAENEHRISTWELIKDYIPQVVNIMVENNEDVARSKIKEIVALDEEQLDYLFDQKIRNICIDRALRQLESLAKVREELAEVVNIRDDEKARYSLIAKELRAIAEKYGTDRVTKVEGPVPEEEKVSNKKEIPNTPVTVFVTKRGFVKAVSGLAESGYADKYLDGGDSLIAPPIYTRLNEFVLLYSQSGCCYKILANDIEGASGKFRQYFWDLVERKDNSSLMYVCAAGEYKGNFTVIYGNGRGRKVYTKEVQGRTRVHKNCFKPNPRGAAAIGYQKFFIITKNGKAAYGDTWTYEQMGLSTGFNVAQIPKDDYIVKIIDASTISGLEESSLKKYTTGYLAKVTDQWLADAAGVKCYPAPDKE